MDPRVETYLAALYDRVENVFADRLVGVYAIGSLALGGFVLGRSDIDVIAVVAGVSDEETKRAVVGALAHPTLECPSRGLEFVLYEQGAVASPRADAAFEINLNTGPGMTSSSSFDPSTDPAHWFVIDRAIARSNAVRLAGIAPEDVFAEIPRAWIIGALLDSLEWHRSHEGSGPNIVLNAARSWRFVAEGLWSSKVDAAVWAKKRGADAALIDAALARRSSRQAATVSAGTVTAFVLQVEEEIRNARDDAS